MRTAIVSDLHLGNSGGEALLGEGAIRRVLLEEISGADRVVLLGDAIELRELPLHAALEAARPFFEELGEALAGREVILVPGNHDFRLAEPLLEGLASADRPLELESLADPEEGIEARLAGWLGAGTPLRIAYPGIWLREDVYATHGHYMDCHMSLPRLECVAAAAVMRFFGAPPDPALPADYERVLRPIYGFSFGLAQGGAASDGGVRPSERAWRALSSRDGQPGRLRRRARRAAVGSGIRAGIWGVNRLLRSEFEPTLTTEAITGSGVNAAIELSRRLRLEAAHVIVGHTHRAGPREDEAAWELAGGGRLHNTGCWTFTTAFHLPGTPPGPYWPGTVTWVEDEGPPRRVRLLEERPREELRAIVKRQRATRR